MAVGLEHPKDIAAVAGIQVGAADAGLRRSAGEDLAIFRVSENTAIAGTLTLNQARAAPVEVAADALFAKGACHPGTPRALIVNSGNANAGLGQRGIDDCREVCAVAARELAIAPHSVIPFSTGVIGEPMPLDKFVPGIARCVQSIVHNDWLAAARAIMTTDTVPKAVTRVIESRSGKRLTLTGIAKGSGMISPNMATMLAFVATDAKVEAAYLQRLLSGAVEASFNLITVDGDTSTNDACILMASGESDVFIEPGSADDDKFSEALHGLLIDLAQSIVRDGEGATKFITITVRSGASLADCRKAAMSVANSPLVKTAMHAADPNWGRIFMAVGKSAAALNMQKLRIEINGALVMADGALASSYREADVAASLLAEEQSIDIDLGFDSVHCASVWTTDLSYEYVRINAEYRS